MTDKFKKSSRLIYYSACVGVINAVLSFNIFTPLEWLISFVSIVFVLFIGKLVSIGYSWMKYILLLFVLVGVSGFPYILQDLKEYPINGILTLIISILQIIATVILFIKQKNQSISE